ncbi:UBC-like protein [Rhizodiscina lignyota]|uniref:UBC-like protein n=1 Tax=Rhizodiscina lignyota TaxID=1504668 RepID=A0A9P4IQH6_9PEZI|nr:UBC-like protein [Rhizodiscina lignyota]
MSTTGQFNKKNPTIKRILKEASELANSTSPDYHAEPLESNLFEWHFTLRGPPAPSPYAGGIYHGRIVLPPTYPLRPPMFRFTTPTGRFEVNREICLSISGHHEETWMPAWGIRTALVAIRSFMDTDAKGQVGGIDCEDSARRKMAEQSKDVRCATCGKTNADIMREKEETIKAMGQEGKQKDDDEVPDELRFAYKDELAKKVEEKATANENAQQSAQTPTSEQQSPVSGSRSAEPAADSPIAPQPPQATTERLIPPPPLPRPGVFPERRRRGNDGVPEWLDKAIWAVFMALALMILKRWIAF